jgi:hypothetical protein
MRWAGHVANMGEMRSGENECLGRNINFLSSLCLLFHHGLYQL